MYLIFIVLGLTPKLHLLFWIGWFGDVVVRFMERGFKIV